MGKLEYVVFMVGVILFLLGMGMIYFPLTFIFSGMMCVGVVIAAYIGREGQH